MSALIFVVMFLPPATKLRQGNVFTSVCQEFCSRGGGVVCVVGGSMHGRGCVVRGACMAGGMCGGGGHVWQEGVCSCYQPQ